MTLKDKENKAWAYPKSNKTWTFIKSSSM